MLQILHHQSRELRDLDVGYGVPRRESLSAFEFLRDYVAKNKPVVITGAIDHWSALLRWQSDEYLIQATDNARVTVALTPTGLADCPVPLMMGRRMGQKTERGRGSGKRDDGEERETRTGRRTNERGEKQEEQEQEGKRENERGREDGEGGGKALKAARGASTDDAWAMEGEIDGEKREQEATGQCTTTDGWCFALPWQRKMPLRDLFALLYFDRSYVVPYCQFQNSSLTEELPSLLEDVESDLLWAAKAFGSGSPEAVNIWIGDQRSRTSFHRDHYENMYCMVRGNKTFRLLPPMDAYRMRLKRWRMATYQPEDPSDAQDDRPVSKLATLRLIPVLHEPLETILWSSVLPQTDDGRKVYCTDNCDTTSTMLGDVLDSSSDDLPEPLVVTIGPGEILYLPSCWWHEVYHGRPFFNSTEETSFSSRVSTNNGRKAILETSNGDGSDKTAVCSTRDKQYVPDIAIAVNYWYEMAFDHGFVAAQTVEALSRQLGLNES